MSGKTTVALAIVTFATAVGCAADEETASEQRVWIDVTQRASQRTPSFVLDPLTPGPLEIDRGRFSTVGGDLGQGYLDGRGRFSTVGGNLDEGYLDGQRYRTFRYTATFTGRAGTLVVRQDDRAVSAGVDYDIVTGTWKVLRGTGIYHGVTGEGRLAVALNAPNPNRPQSRQWTEIHARYEGYLATPPLPD